MESLQDFKNVLSSIQEEKNTFNQKEQKYLNHLSKDLKKQIAAVTKTYHQKLNYESSLEFQQKIQAIDQNFQANQKSPIEQLNSYGDQYTILKESYSQLPAYQRNDKINLVLSQRIQSVRLALENQVLQTAIVLNETFEKKINLSTFKSYIKDFTGLGQSYKNSPYFSYNEKIKQTLQNSIENSFRQIIDSIDNQFQSEQEPTLLILETYEKKYETISQLYNDVFEYPIRTDEFRSIFLERKQMIYREKNNAFLRLVQAIDRELKSKPELTFKNLTFYKKKYKKVRKSYLKLPHKQYLYKTEKLMNERIETINRQVIFKKEQQADQLYTSLQFNSAYDRYLALSKEIDSYTIGSYLKQQGRIQKKQSTTISSAQSYIDSQIQPLLNLAKANHGRYILDSKMKSKGTKGTNSKFYKKKSLKLLKKVFRTLKKNNPLFLKVSTVLDYNQTAQLINQSVDLNYSVGNLLMTPFRFVGNQVPLVGNVFSTPFIFLGNQVPLAKNVLSTPFIYAANIGKGITDIFVFRFGWGLGAGAEVGIFGGGGLFADLPVELSTAYTPQEVRSRISSLYLDPQQPFYSEQELDGDLDVFGWGFISYGVCVSGLLMRFCGYGGDLSSDNISDSDPLSYTNVNVWVGLGPAMMINIETHRLVELVGVLLGQDWNITGNKADKTERFKYFPFKMERRFEYFPFKMERRFEYFPFEMKKKYKYFPYKKAKMFRLAVAVLERANLRGAKLRGAVLEGAKLRGADLYRADLRGAGLGGADLRGADLEGAKLRGADLRGADLGGADLRGADLEGAKLRGADLRGTTYNSEIEFPSSFSPNREGMVKRR